MLIALVAAVARNGVIGAGGGLPWRLPADLAHFKRLTMGRPVIMGRATFESIGKPLPGRQNIVLSRKADFVPSGCVVARSLAEALHAAGGAAEVFVIGGRSVYEQALERADRLYLTLVHCDAAGDVLFPPYEHLGWREVARRERAPDARNPYALVFVTLERAYDPPPAGPGPAGGG